MFSFVFHKFTNSYFAFSTFVLLRLIFKTHWQLSVCGQNAKNPEAASVHWVTWSWPEEFTWEGLGTLFRQHLTLCRELQHKIKISEAYHAYRSAVGHAHSSLGPSQWIDESVMAALVADTCLIGGFSVEGFFAISQKVCHDILEYFAESSWVHRFQTNYARRDLPV